MFLGAIKDSGGCSKRPRDLNAAFQHFKGEKMDEKCGKFATFIQQNQKTHTLGSPSVSVGSCLQPPPRLAPCRGP